MRECWFLHSGCRRASLGYADTGGSIRGNVVDLLNHAQLFNPIGNLNSRNLGDITGARDPRFISLACN